MNVNPSIGTSIDALAELIRDNRPCVVLTGAGISTEMRAQYRI